MNKVFTYHNCDCLKCKVVHNEMVGVGSLVFCNLCFLNEFKTDNPVIEERELYLKWLDINKKEIYDTL